jgi:hypothetical protein
LGVSQTATVESEAGGFGTTRRETHAAPEQIETPSRQRSEDQPASASWRVVSWPPASSDPIVA